MSVDSDEPDVQSIRRTSILMAIHGDPLVRQKDSWNDQYEREYQDWISGP